MREGDDFAARLERAGLESGDGQQLADHPRQPVGLLADDPEPSVRPVAAELVGVGPDARQRRLEVVAHAAQEVVLRGVELEQLAVLRLDLGEQLGIADRDRDLAREQLEEVLVGALPAAGRRQVPDQHARAPRRRARRTARTGSGLARDTLLDAGSSPGRRAGRPQSIIPKAARASLPARPAMKSALSRGDALSIASRIRPSSRLRRSRSAARRLWLSARRASSSSPGTTIGVDRSPAGRRSTAAAIARSGAVRSAARR